ncbi:MAG TPA: ABC transporter permease subunit [Acidimicrobiales bacterium]|nr:ABC transporter permease subunit [Acidimicrobiales bacterium]
MSWTRVRAIFRKELREYRRNGFILATMAIVPLFFIVLPMIEVFAASPSTPAAHSLLKGGPLTYMLGIPAIVPTTAAAFAIVGERQQGTLEPVLSTPVRREEFLIAKALAVMAPSLAISYGWYCFVLVCAALFANPELSAAIFRAPELLAQVVFTPLIAGWSISSSIAISARSSDVRVAQQLGSLVSLPPLAMAVLVSFYVVHPTAGLVIGLAALLVLVDTLGWKAMLAMFNRERLVVGAKT